MIPERLRRFLDAHQVKYRVLAHVARWDAQRTAQSAHVSGKVMAKLVLLRGRRDPSRFAAAVLPAHEEVDLSWLGQALGYQVELASEDEYQDLFPDYELGAAPPTAALEAGLPLLVDTCLSRQRWLLFNGGTHTDLVEMTWADFERITAPRVLDYGRVMRAGPPPRS